MPAATARGLDTAAVQRVGDLLQGGGAGLADILDHRADIGGKAVGLGADRGMPASPDLGEVRAVPQQGALGPLGGQRLLGAAC